VFFDTPIYFLFLTLVVLVYWCLGWRRQNVLLLAASYVFYGWWDPRFLGLIALSTVVDFSCARAIANTSDARRRKALLTISLVINFGFLATFKYFNFFMDSFAVVLEALGFHQTPIAVLKILLPPGISFYTFQEVAYIVDVYKRRLMPDLGRLMNFSSVADLRPLFSDEVERVGTGRIARMQALASAYGARLVVLIPVMLETKDGNGWLGLMNAARGARVSALMPAAAGSFRRSLYRDAGFHLNPEGAAAFTELLIPALQKELSAFASVVSASASP